MATCGGDPSRRVGPGIGRELVQRHLDAPEVVIAEAALGALVWTDRPDEALPVLLRYADGGPGSGCAVAAGRAARHIPLSRLPDVLGPVLTGPAKITGRKEAALLLARCGRPQVMTMLLEAYHLRSTKVGQIQSFRERRHE